MAKLPALISVIAKFDPRGEATVENHARKLRAGGIMTTGKRGVGAPDMNSSDVTNLIFSMVSRRADEVVETVKALRGAKLEGPLKGEADFSDVIEGFSFADRMKNSENFVLAGKFMDGLVEDLTPHRDCLESDGVSYQLERLEIHDPKTGFGKVIFVFRTDCDDVFTLRFNAVSKVITDPNDLPPYQIQGTIILDQYVLGRIIADAQVRSAA